MKTPDSAILSTEKLLTDIIEPDNLVQEGQSFQ